MSYDFEELNAYSENLGNYDVIVVDSDTPAPLKILKEKCDRLIFFSPAKSKCRRYRCANFTKTFFTYRFFKFT